ncbi:MAG: DUF302 domain-containing protein [bacterium]|nr:DUF302 domain-containing protein [bacterium]
MKYIVNSKKTMGQAVLDLQEAVKANGFGILHTYDLKSTLKSKGIDLPEECQIFEICNPKQAAAVLAEDMSINMALPCRISIWQEGGITRIGMIPPKAMLESLSNSPVLHKIAAEVEEKMKAMIDIAK